MTRIGLCGFLTAGRDARSTGFMFVMERIFPVGQASVPAYIAEALLDT
jgi:hypothetical protein